MGKYKYITNRTVVNKEGKETGRIRVLVKIDSSIAEVNYKCPECGHEEHVEKPWKRPFSVKCSKCGFLIRLPRLKNEIKRSKKRK